MIEKPLNKNQKLSLLNKVEDNSLNYNLLNKSNNSLEVLVLKNMTFSSIANSPLDNLYKSLEQEKYMLRELIKKGLSTTDSKKASSVAIFEGQQNKSSLNLKVKNIKIYTENLVRSKHVELSEVYSYSITKQMLIETKNKESEITVTISNEGLENAEQKNISTKNYNGEQPETVEANVKLPSFIYYYPNISLNESIVNAQDEVIAEGNGKGILNNSTINYNKYLKKLTYFNAGIAAKKSIGFKFVEKIRISIKNLYKLLVASLNPTKALISQPYINESANEIKINLFFFLFAYTKINGEARNLHQNMVKNNQISPKGGTYQNLLSLDNLQQSYIQKNAKRLSLLCENLSQIFQKKITLGLTRLYDPRYESQILATSMGSLTKIKKIRFNKIKSNFFRRLKTFNLSRIIDNTLFDYNSLCDNKNINPAYLSGVSVKLAGRLITEKVVPRKTVRAFQIGSLARSKSDLVITDRFTKKNKRGCFSLTIKTGHFIN